MGTGKSGRYLNTKGSARSVSHFALVHSIEGKLTHYLATQNGKKVEKLRLASGGHGQYGLELLKKYHIQYNIVKTYPNGVRLGNIPNHRDKRKRMGMNQAWFPANWNSKDIKHAGEHVAGLKANRHSQDGVPVFGVYKGVRVGIIRTHGKIATVFPDTKQPHTK